VEYPVARRLGGRKTLHRSVQSELQLAQAVREGLPSAALDYMLAALTPDAGTQAEVYGVVGSARTLQRKRAARKPLSPEESDRLARLARILVHAEDTFGTPEKARRWLGRSNWALGGVKPLSLLDNDAGALLVDQVLGRIQHGIPS
jgi:putative toxin-antitoxin system antitoxin component (TIGR02293 family)